MNVLEEKNDKLARRLDYVITNKQWRDLSYFIERHLVVGVLRHMTTALCLMNEQTSISESTVTTCLVVLATALVKHDMQQRQIAA